MKHEWPLSQIHGSRLSALSPVRVLLAGDASVPLPHLAPQISPEAEGRAEWEWPGTCMEECMCVGLGCVGWDRRGGEIST